MHFAIITNGIGDHTVKLANAIQSAGEDATIIACSGNESANIQILEYDLDLQGLENLYQKLVSLNFGHLILQYTPLMYVNGNHNNAGLVKELPLAILTAIFALVGATIYTIVVSRNVTRGQTWIIVGGLGSQIAFIYIYGIQSTSDALILNLLPEEIYVIVQATILIVVINKWPSKNNNVL